MKSIRGLKLLSKASSKNSHSYSKQCIVLLGAIVSVNVAFANPQGGSVTSGSATITQVPNSTVVQQSSQQAIIQWNSFNINKGETTQFVQPNSSSVALNRINPSQGVSQIYGNLTSNGQVILVNAAGIHFGSTASVNVGGLIASTSDILDSNFLAGKYVFDQSSTYHNAGILNEGRIIAANYGLVALIGSNVSNTGFIQAELGSVVLGAGSKFTLDFNGDQLINFTVDAPAAAAQVNNSGSLIADGGKVLVTAQAAQSVLDNVINMGGVTQVNSVAQQNGEIVLSTNASVSVTGKMLAQGTAAGTSGGTIQVSANNLTTAPQSVMDASGNAGGGNVDISVNSILTNGQINAVGTGANSLGGNVQIAANNFELGGLINASGDFLGGSVTVSGVPVNNSQTNAANITLDPWGEIAANATGTDSVLAGNINLYANNEQIYGYITATDTNTGGIGGNVGIYGQNVYIQPFAYIDTSANFLGGVVNIGGNPLSTSSNTMSNNVLLGFDSYVSAAATGNNGFGSEINISGNTVSLAGELDVSGNPFPTVTYVSSGNSNSNYGFGGGGMCGGGNGGGQHLTPVITNSGSSAGVITVTGNNITVQSSGYLNAAGNMFGGEILLGSSPQAGVLTTASININAGSLLDAGSYGTTGNTIGGEIQMYAANTTVNSTLNASAVSTGTSLGGEVNIFAQNSVNVNSSASILANGDSGGEVLIGGDLNGIGGDPDAQYTNIAYHSYISASSLSNGTGGEVVVWSNNTTNYSGSIIARGGPQGGNGGQVEVASGGTLNFTKLGTVNVSAPHGTAGTVTK